MLLILLLGIADFGRVFTAGITIEAAARDGAEAGALERLRNHPPPAGSAFELDYYDSLHAVAARAACSEARLLENTTFTQSDGTCPGMPILRVCVHDGQDPQCGLPVPGFASTIPTDPATGASQCPLVSAMASGPDNASPGETASHAVEVRLCYRFTTLLNLHMGLPFNWSLSLGDVWLERSRNFVVDCPLAPVASC